MATARRIKSPKKLVPVIKLKSEVVKL